MYIMQWKSNLMDTLGLLIVVLIREVSSSQRLTVSVVLISEVVLYNLM